MRTLTLFTALALSLAGCPSGTDATDDPTDDTDTDTDTEAELDYVVAGTVTDGTGAAVESASVFLCNVEICYQQFTDADGEYGFIRGDGSFALKVDAEGMPIVSTSIVSADGQDERTVDVVMPAFDFDMSVPTSSGEHELAPGFHASFSASEIEIPDTSDENVAGGAAVAEADRLPIDDAPSTGTLVGLYYLAPYDAKAKNGGVPFRVSNAEDLGLADDDVVEIYVHSYKVYTTDAQATSQWLSAGEATVTGGELQGSLPYLATVALYKK